MRQILLFVAPLLLAACSIENSSDTRDPKATEKFIDGYLQTITLNQISGSAATVDQVRTIASQYIYDGANKRFINKTVVGYKPSLQEGVDARGFRTITLDSGNGSAKFIFNKKDHVRDTVALSVPSHPKYKVIDEIGE